IVTGSGDNTLTVWDARTGAALLELKGHNRVTSVAFSPDGKRSVTASDGDGAVKVWDAEKVRHVLLDVKGGNLGRGAARFSPDGTRILTSVGVWDASRTVGLPTVLLADESGSGRLELNGDREDVLSVAFSPDGTRIVTADGVFEGPFRDRNATKLSVATVWD